MAYDNPTSLPAYVKKYDAKLQRQWAYVFNTTHNKTKSENRAIQAANSILKKRFIKKDSMMNNTRKDYFSQLIDQWLGNLDG